MNQPETPSGPAVKLDGCPDPEILASLLDGRLPAVEADESGGAERARLEEHVASCPDCLQTLAVAAKALESLSRAARRPLMLRRWAAAAAALPLLAAGAWFALSGREAGKTAPVEAAGPAAAADMAQAAADPRGVELAGGFLAASGTGDASTLCVQSDGETLRWALVRGSVFVELGPNAPPVRLVTPHATVTVDPGEVQLAVSRTRTDVVVRAGVATMEGSGESGALRLTAGQAAVAQASKGAVRVAPPDVARLPDWVRSARARRLEEIANEVSSGPAAAGGF
jgi:hypothetical protein